MWMSSNGMDTFQYFLFVSSAFVSSQMLRAKYSFLGTFCSKLQRGLWTRWFYMIRYNAHITQNRQNFSNKLILKVGQLLTSIIVSCMMVMSFITATPLKDLFPYGCETFYFMTASHNTILICSGFIMGVLRMVCVKYSTYISIKLDTMVDIILWVQYVWIGFLVGGFCVGGRALGSTGLLEFCRGYTKEVHFSIQYSPLHLFIVKVSGCWYLDEIWGYWRVQHSRGKIDHDTFWSHNPINGRSRIDCLHHFIPQSHGTW